MLVGAGKSWRPQQICVGRPPASCNDIKLVVEAAGSGKLRTGFGGARLRRPAFDVRIGLEDDDNFMGP